jgi:hypothetical protein
LTAYIEVTQTEPSLPSPLAAAGTTRSVPGSVALPGAATIRSSAVASSDRMTRVGPVVGRGKVGQVAPVRRIARWPAVLMVGDPGVCVIWPPRLMVCFGITADSR